MTDSRNNTTYTLARFTLAVIVAITALLTPTGAGALPLTHYAEESALADGRWVKVAVTNTGLHRISASTLRSWGFASPQRVRVHGYGGRRIPNTLNAANYVDDLPQVPVAFTSDGIVFWAEGPGEWTISTGNNYHWVVNPYANAGYYYITESDTDAPDIPTAGRPGATSPTTVTKAHVHHELELVSPGEAGLLLVGEDFKYTPSRTFTFDMPGRIPDSNVWMECSFVARTFNNPSTLSFKYNGTPVNPNSTDRIPAVSNQEYYHGAEGVAQHDAKLAGDATQLKLDVTHSATTAVQSAWLNYITVGYERGIELPQEGWLDFRASTTGVALGGANANVHVWDVTDPRKVLAMNTSTDGTTVSWTNDYTGRRQYVAWRTDARLPEPAYVQTMSNQNLHSHGAVGMVIVTYPALRSQAERLAEIHRNSADSLSVRVVMIDEIYNEFSSGTGDVSAIRKYFKMLYDRGNAVGKPLRFALLMGRMTYDCRGVTVPFRSLGITTIPAWYPAPNSYSLSDNDGFGTDDFVAMLDDNSGYDLGLDKLSIAVGRIPATSADDAREIIDKLVGYMERPKPTAWKQRMLFLADDRDKGIHLDQTEKMIAAIEETPLQQFVVNKVYMDAYTKQNGHYPEARADMFRMLDEGVVWWNYVGHANNHTWSHDGQLTFNDMNNLYLRNVPFVYAATCDFLRWDSNTMSGGEILYKERYGGAIGMISATRPVYISENGRFSLALGRSLARRDAQGRYYTIGEIYQNAKNNIMISGKVESNPNRLRFVLMGDPAMRLAAPSNIVTLDTIAGVAVDGENQPTLAALQQAVVTGSVTAPDGTLLDDFNGTVLLEIYDAEKSVTTNGNGDDGKVDIFETHGDKVYTGATSVKGGRYEITVAMPAEVSHNFRPATMSLFAYSDVGTEAAGLNRDFYIYGFDETVAPDTVPPTIGSLVLNHTGFRSGDRVNASPMLIATVSDNVGINVSTAGVGHQMSLLLDGKRSFNDVSAYFTPASDGSIRGTINYQLEDLTDGSHTLRLRVWDTAGNLTEQNIDFIVDASKSPVIFDLMCDANPATTEANFYLTHDRPDGIVTVNVTVYDLAGRQIWTGTQSGLSDSDRSVPVTWNLTDASGRRVPRGIYLYRATIVSEGTTYPTATRKIAVASPR